MVVGISLARSMVNTTSSAVKSLPSCHFTPWRRWNTYSRPSSLMVQSVASRGTASNLAPLNFTKPSKIRTHIQYSSLTVVTWGSREVMSLVMRRFSVGWAFSAGSLEPGAELWAGSLLAPGSALGAAQPAIRPRHRANAISRETVFFISVPPKINFTEPFHRCIRLRLVYIAIIMPNFQGRQSSFFNVFPIRMCLF